MWRVLTSAVRVGQRMLVSKAQLAAENVTLRHQLGMAQLRLQERASKVQPRPWERAVLAFLTRLFPWKERSAVPLFKPATIVRWHRQAFRVLWTYKSRKRMPHRGGRPRTPDEVRDLVREMAAVNGWGSERIVGELLKVGISLHHKTVQRILEEKPQRPRRDQRWLTFIHNHLPEIWACDFFTVPTWCFRQLYVFVVMKLETRKILHVNVTEHPTDPWCAQQMREAIGWRDPPRFLVRDRDKKYGKQFNAVVKSVGTKTKLTPKETPVANAYCERLVRSFRQEATNHIVPIDADHLRRHLLAYKAYYNHSRPHQGLGQRIPARASEPALGPTKGRIVRRPVMGGLIHVYERTPHRAA